MKLFVVLVFLAVTACSSLSNPQGAAQSVRMIDVKSQTYKTTCNGAVEDWSNCFGRASKSCANGYNVLERLESPIGGKRELTFQCKK